MSCKITAINRMSMLMFKEQILKFIYKIADDVFNPPNLLPLNARNIPHFILLFKHVQFITQLFLILKGKKNEIK